jgi:hypothetical protein
MTGRLVRNFCLCLVFIAGALSIMATSAPPPPFHFRKVEIEPAYRCPGSDVAVRWTLSQVASVSVAVGETELVTTSNGGALLPAEVLEHNAPVATLTLRLEAEDADEPSIHEITTLGSGRTIEKLAFRAGDDEFRTHDRDLWDERARVLGIKIEQVRSLACAGGNGSPPAWEVSPPSGPSFIVRAENGYSAALDPPPPPGGDWRFRPKGGECRLPSSGLEPYLSIHLIAQCVVTGGAS